jgi:hypothetical protein
VKRGRLTADQRPLYVFALCAPDHRIPEKVGRHRLECIALGGLVAIVERRIAAPVLSERSLRDQHRVIVALHQHATALVPVRFGALLDRGELEGIVRRRRALLTQALKRVRGMAQMTIRSFESRSHPAAAPPAATGTAYLARLARSVRPDVPAAVDAVRQAVRTLVVDESIDAGRGAVRVVVNHLIRVGDVDRYRARAESALTGAAAFESVVLTGPWPPFAFAPEITDVAS